MFRILPFLLLISCNSIKIKQKEMNWVEVYKNELKIARENNDIESWMFFWPEYLKELDELK